MHRTLVIRREYLHYVPKYNRYERRHKNLSAHVSPAFRVEEGDMVTVGQCRPLSKTVRFRPISGSFSPQLATNETMRYCSLAALQICQHVSCYESHN